MLMKPATLLKLWSVRKNVRGGRGALIFVEQLHPFIGIKYPRDEPLASELTSSFYFWVVDRPLIRQRWAVEPVETAPPRNAQEKVRKAAALSPSCKLYRAGSRREMLNG